jgi:Na+-translocating ferredoxin:NAD+ oxidoreductase RnfG subunit
MSPLAKEIIHKLSNEKDSEVLAEVLDFYEYIKQKKDKELKNKWSRIEEDEPTENEVKLYEEYKNNKEEGIPLENVIKELNLDAK